MVTEAINLKDTYSVTNLDSILKAETLLYQQRSV